MVEPLQVMLHLLEGICIGRGVSLRGDKDASPFGPRFLDAEQDTASLPHHHHHEGLTSFLILHHLRTDAAKAEPTQLGFFG